MNFDDWFEQPERDDELAALVDFAHQEAEGDEAEAQGLLLYFALRMGWEQALRQGSALRASCGPEGLRTLH
jgi:hypothetical protein